MLRAFLTSFLLLAGAVAATPSEVEYLSERGDLILNTRQDWGVLGLDVAAHQANVPGLPLRIGGKSYLKGLGHHAGGAIQVLLDGEYAHFNAEAGIQDLGSTEGSVVFRVLVDGKLAFESGVMRQADSAKAIHVGLEGAQELVLEVADAGDGINCDMANWADARLTRSAVGGSSRREPEVNIAQFARVVAWDPNRLDGVRASRIEEFPAEDLFLEKDLRPERDGAYVVPVATNGLGCIGLQWLERRALRELGLGFASLGGRLRAEDIEVQGWYGESAWQGQWRPLVGSKEVEGTRLGFRLSASREPGGLPQLRKVRWVFPPALMPVVVREITAYTYSRWATVELRVQTEGNRRGEHGRVSLYNGEWVFPTRPQASPRGSKRETAGLQAAVSPPSVIRWDLAEPLKLAVRYSRYSRFRSDATVLRFESPRGSFGVAIDDLLTNDCVYIPTEGFLVSREPFRTTISAQKRRVASRKSTLEEVRAMPEQTLAQAMARTHHAVQREGPVMLSLACDNTKFVVDRDGTIHFQHPGITNEDWFTTAGEMRPQFGDGKAGELSRRLEGGWLPIPVIAVTNHGLAYCQRTFVAPADEPLPNPTRLNRRSVCVGEFTVTNPNPSLAQATLTLAFRSKARQEQSVQVLPCTRGFLVQAADGPLALVDTNHAAPLAARLVEGVLTLSGQLGAQTSARCVVFWRGQKVNPSDVALLDQPEKLRAEVELYWSQILATGADVRVPDPLLDNLIRSSRVRCLIAARNEAEGTRIAPWIAAMSYGPLESEAHSVIRGMDLLGHADFAQRGLDYFIHRYNTAGFLTTGYTTFGTPWHLWTVGEHFRLHLDEAWFRSIAPEVTRVGHWILRQLRKTRLPGKENVGGQLGGLATMPEYNGGYMRPEAGLMPPGVLADWNAFAYHFCMNAYCHAALRELGEGLRAVSNPDGQLFQEQAAILRDDIRVAFHWTRARSPVVALRNGTWGAAYPSQVHSPGPLANFFPGEDAGRSWCYDVELGAHQMVPAGVAGPDWPWVTEMLDHMEDVQFLADGWFDYPARENQQDWFNLGGFSKVQPYYTRNAEIYALRNDRKPFLRSYFNTIAALVNPEVLTFWEHFHHSGAWDKTHETGYFLQQTRFMLVGDQGEELWLAPLVPSEWFRDGSRFGVARAPTRFGSVSYMVESELSQKGWISASLEPPTREAPKTIAIWLRHPEGKRIKAATVNGVAHKKFDPATGCVRLEPGQGRVVVRATY